MDAFLFVCLAWAGCATAIVVALERTPATEEGQDGGSWPPAPAGMPADEAWSIVD